jgi:FixJ family two-component response regulator
VFLSHPLALSGAALVITDIKLRGMSGLELFDKLRLLAVPPPPVLFISGHADENMQRYALIWAPLHFCVSPLTSIFCWIIFSGSWPADNKDRG